MSAIPANVPAVGRARPFRMPAFADTVLRNGLRVVAVRRPTVPRVEARMRIPAGLIHDRGDAVRARLVGETLVAGTKSRSSVEIARELQRLGASLDAGVSADDLMVGGGALSGSLSGLLALLAEVVTAPAFPSDEVAVARDRVAQEIVINRSQPAGIAAEMTLRRIFGRHPYGRGLPSPDAVRRATAGPLRAFHAEHVLPRGASLVLVGDLQPDDAVAQVQETFKTWKGRKVGPQPGEPASFPTGLSTLIVDRPGSVQTNIRVVGPALPRSDPGFLSLALANMLYGGYFSSRLTKNIREDKGYTYSPSSIFEQRRLASTFVTAAEVRTEVTAPSLVEIRYELGRLAAMPAGPDELEAARRYLAGVTMLSIQTQAGLAAYVAGLLTAGLNLDYLAGFRDAIEAVTADDVHAAAMRFMAPRNTATILVGDAAKIRDGVAALEDVDVVPAP